MVSAFDRLSEPLSPKKRALVQGLRFLALRDIEADDSEITPSCIALYKLASVVAASRADNTDENDAMYRDILAALQKLGGTTAGTFDTSVVEKFIGDDEGEVKKQNVAIDLLVTILVNASADLALLSLTTAFQAAFLEDSILNGVAEALVVFALSGVALGNYLLYSRYAAVHVQLSNLMPKRGLAASPWPRFVLGVGISALVVAGSLLLSSPADMYNKRHAPYAAPSNADPLVLSMQPDVSAPMLYNGTFMCNGTTAGTVTYIEYTARVRLYPGTAYGRVEADNLHVLSTGLTEGLPSGDVCGVLRGTSENGLFWPISAAMKTSMALTTATRLLAPKVVASVRGMPMPKTLSGMYAAASYGPQGVLNAVGLLIQLFAYTADIEFTDQEGGVESDEKAALVQTADVSKKKIWAEIGVEAISDMNRYGAQITFFLSLMLIVGGHMAHLASTSGDTGQAARLKNLGQGAFSLLVRGQLIRAMPMVPLMGASDSGLAMHLPGGSVVEPHTLMPPGDWQGLATWLQMAMVASYVYTSSFTVTWHRANR